jgi:hypothetical protein
MEDYLCVGVFIQKSKTYNRNKFENSSKERNFFITRQMEKLFLKNMWMQNRLLLQKKLKNKKTFC